MLTKTKFLFFHSDRSRAVKPVLSINNTLIERVDTFNVLGLFISRDLKWKTLHRDIAWAKRRISLINIEINIQYFDAPPFTLLYIFVGFIMP